MPKATNHIIPKNSFFIIFFFFIAGCKFIKTKLKLYENPSKTAISHVISLKKYENCLHAFTRP